MGSRIRIVFVSDSMSTACSLAIGNDLYVLHLRLVFPRCGFWGLNEEHLADITEALLAVGLRPDDGNRPRAAVCIAEWLDMAMGLLYTMAVRLPELANERRLRAELALQGLNL